MPFRSDAQRRWGHSAAGLAALGGKAKVAEWDAATPAHLPERAKRGPKRYVKPTRGAHFLKRILSR